MIKRLLIKLGVHGQRHEVARIRREIKEFNNKTMILYMFWQGEHGGELNRWRMK